MIIISIVCCLGYTLLYIPISIFVFFSSLLHGDKLKHFLLISCLIIFVTYNSFSIPTIYSIIIVLYDLFVFYIYGTDINKIVSEIKDAKQTTFMTYETVIRDAVSQFILSRFANRIDVFIYDKIFNYTQFRLNMGKVIVFIDENSLERIELFMKYMDKDKIEEELNSFPGFLWCLCINEKNSIKFGYVYMNYIDSITRNKIYLLSILHNKHVLVEYFKKNYLELQVIDMKNEIEGCGDNEKIKEWLIKLSDEENFLDFLQLNVEALKSLNNEEINIIFDQYV